MEFRLDELKELLAYVQACIKDAQRQQVSTTNLVRRERHIRTAIQHLTKTNKEAA